MKLFLNLNKSFVCLWLAVSFVLLAGCLSAYAGVLSDEFITNGGLNPEKVSVKIIDLSNSKVLEEHNPQLPLVPASITKAVTIATLTELEDLDFRFSTRVYLTGKVKDHVLDGNILIVGSGDPTLNSSAGPASGDFIDEIIKAVKKFPIDTIRGRIVINQEIYPGPAQSPLWGKGDLSQAYGTGCYGFNFQSNRSGKAAVANPSAVFSAMLKKSLEQEGVLLLNETVNNGKEKLIVNHKSATLDEIMRSCMMRSDNLYAEAILRQCALARNRVGTTNEGAFVESDYWKRLRLPVEGVKLVDGSGLSRTNRITADFMAELLQHMSRNVYYASFFPLAGQEGTLKRFLSKSELDSYVAMKTGSMNGIQCYAGYKLDDNYAPTHAIVIMINELLEGRDKARNAAAQMLLQIFGENVESTEESIK